MLFLTTLVGPVFADAPVVDYSSDIGSSHTARSFPLKSEGELPASLTSATSSKYNLSNLSMEQRINKLEHQISHVNEQNLSSKVEELQQRLQKMNGQLEDQAHQIEQLNIQLKGFYQDLNNRLDGGKLTVNNRPEASSVAIPKDEMSKDFGKDIVKKESPAKKSETAIVPATDDNMAEAFAGGDGKKAEKKTQADSDKAFLEEQQMYQTAIDLLPDKKYEASESKLRGYLKSYPKGAYVANAHYWLGEINFLQKNFDAAEEEFRVVVDKHAKSKRVSDAMFKLALVHQNQGRDAQSKQELKQIMKRFPGTSAAQLAKQQLAGG